VTEFAEQLIDDLRERATAAFDEFGKEVLDGLQQSISTPVEYIGGSTIRSLPGEPPRLEFSDLFDSYDTETEQLLQGVSESIFSDLPRSRWLEYGSGRIKPRPHVKPIFDRYAALAAEAIGRRMFQT
jgi:hypothetical protein